MFKLGSLVTQERGHLRELYEGVPTEAGPTADQPATGQEEAASGNVAEESKEAEAPDTSSATSKLQKFTQELQRRR